jgi:TonB family protein
MPARSNTNLNSLPGNLYVRKFEMVCDMHGLPFGSPANLTGFVQALDTNKHLAMDFWSLVARMSDADGPATPKPGTDAETGAAAERVSDGRTLNGRLLETIVEGVTGQSVADVISAGGDARRSVGDLASLLAGEDIYAPAGLPSVVLPDPPAEKIVPAGPTPVVKARSGFGSFADAVAGARSEEPAEPMDIEPVAIEPVEIKLAELKPITLEPAPVEIEPAPVKIEPAPVKIERVQVKQSAVEPVAPKPEIVIPEEVGPIAPVLSFAEMKRMAIAEAVIGAAQPVVEVVTEPVVERPKVVSIPKAEIAPVEIPKADPPAPILSRDENKRLVLKPELPLEKAPADPVAKALGSEVRTERVPMQGYAESNARSGRLRFAGWLLAVIILVGAGFFGARYYGLDLWQQFTSGLQQLRGGSQPAIPAPTESKLADAAESAAVPPSPQEETVVTPPSTRPATGNGGRTPNRVEPSKPVGPVDQTAPASGGSGGAVSVPRDVMQASRISSVAPIYPEMARQNGIEGRVVLQVIVSKDGTVGHLHVVAGDPVLRSAAMQAVSKWRYWPYLVNGEPVDVSTMVTVDFTLGE